MAEGIALLVVCIMMVMLMFWLVAHDSAPEGKTSGLFAIREAADMPYEKEPDETFLAKRMGGATRRQ